MRGCYRMAPILRNSVLGSTVLRAGGEPTQIMRGLSVVLVVVLSCLGFARPDRNAFLNVRAVTVAQLVEQVRKDPEVMDRYRRHYSMNDAEVLAFLSGLKLARIVKAGTYQVYSVPPDGSIKMSVRNFREGTPVFADVFAKPVLILKCGNPLDRGPKDPRAPNDPDPGLETTATTEMREGELTNEGLPELDELTAMTPDVPTLVDLPEEIITINESPIPMIIPASPFGGGWLLGLLGGGFILGGSDSDDNPGDTVVPEPATLGIMAIGAGGLLLRRARRRQR